jgi:hypothetical protein
LRTGKTHHEVAAAPHELIGDAPLDGVPEKSAYLSDVGEGQTRVDQAQLA